MKIIHITNNDYDGGGQAVYSLHTSLKDLGEDSIMLVSKKKKDDKSVVRISSNRSFFCKVLWKLKTFKWSPVTLFNFNISFIWIKNIESYIKDADIVCLYSVQSFLSSGVIREIMSITNAPIVWTPLDAEPLTGGCHFNGDCNGFEYECNKCPQLKNKGRFLSSIIWNRKKKDYKGNNFIFISASSWVERHIKASALFKSNRVERIMLGINKDIFSPYDMKEARLQIGLPADKKIILFGCLNWNDKRKGSNYLVEALRALQAQLIAQREDPDSVVLVTFGKKKYDILPEDIKFGQIHMGFVDGGSKMASLFQSSDVFVSSSIDDFGPLVVIQAFMCKVPVVAFDIGVALDLVTSGHNGYIAKNKNPEELAQGIEQMLFNTFKYEDDGPIREKCDKEYQAKQYQKLFEQLTREQTAR